MGDIDDGGERDVAAQAREQVADARDARRRVSDPRDASWPPAQTRS